MIGFSKRRLFVRAGWFALFAVLMIVAYRLYAPTLGGLAYLSGWLLMFVMLVLAGYNARKKLPFLPLGSSEGWLQFHTYAGWFAVLLFLMHVSFRVPSGWFEGTLAWLYVLVTVSGIVGLAISRRFPKRLTARGGEVLFERIPVLRRHLREQAEALALKSVPAGESTTIADFYVRSLSDFFGGNRNLRSHLFDSHVPLNRVLERINELNRYLNEPERGVMAEIAALVRQKDTLDYHYALQLTLKLWLFIHLPLTYALLLWSLLHIVLVYAFSGGAG